MLFRDGELIDVLALSSHVLTEPNLVRYADYCTPRSRQRPLRPDSEEIETAGYSAAKHFGWVNAFAERLGPGYDICRWRFLTAH